jgi:GT2 family glycosyltransferase
MTVGVIIVNYFTEDLLRPLVQRVAAFPMVRQLVVFDNGSSSPLSFGEGHVQVLGEGRNLGFGAAVNRAFAALDTDYVLLLNPDLRLDAACVARLLEASRRYQAPIAGPRFYWDDECFFRLPPATGELRWLGVGAGAPSSLDGRLRDHTWAVYHDHYWAARAPFRQPFLPGACLLLAGDWLRARGRVFDERYFMYFEDTDLCIEAQREGWMPLCVPGAEVVHYWDQSPEPTGGKARMMAEAGRALRHKYALPQRDPLEEMPLLPPVPTVPPLDLGEVVLPPQFGLPACPAGTRFEIAVEPGFVPFAQAEVDAVGLVPFGGSPVVRALARAKRWRAAKAGLLTLPAPLWSRLRPGCYHARLRGPDGVAGQQWQWRRGT